MDIASRIKQYRLDKSLTQEQLASYLGVTAAAVNKWEKGKSLPDIMLIAPLARLMNTTTDDLLSFEKQMTQEQLENHMKRLSEMTKKCEFSDIYKAAMDTVKEYPSSDELILSTAQFLYGNMMIMGQTAEIYKSGIQELFERVVDSSDCRIVRAAVTILFYMYVNNKEYDKAHEYLDKISENDIEYLKMKAVLASRQDLKNESYEAIEKVIYTSYNNMSWALQFLTVNYMKDDNYDMADKVVEVERNLADALEMGRYMSASTGLELAVARKDEEECLRLLDIMADNILNINDFTCSFLFAHLNFSKFFQSAKYADVLKKGFEEDESLAFLRKNERFHSIMKKFEIAAAREVK